MVVNQSAGKIKKFGLVTALTAAATLVGATYATGALADGPMLAKSAPMAYAPPPPAACGSVYDFFFTACPLSWYGVTVYGTVDLGADYMTHGSGFDRNFPTGLQYLVNSGGAAGTSRTGQFRQAPNGLSQSNVGVKVIEPIAPGGWSFVGQFELAFDPYSGLLANAPQALQNGIGVPNNQQLIPVDSSRWGWLNTNQYVGVSNPFAGTLTFGRQNTPETDGVGAYDPMGGSYAFSPIGYSGKTAGGGDTEDARWTTAIKYRVNIGDGRFSAMVQPIGLFSPNGSCGACGYGAFNPNNGAASLGVGGDIKHSVPGVISWDLIGTYEKDATNVGTAGGVTANTAGWPTAFPGGAASGLKATISNNLAGMALVKWSFGSWGNASPIVGKDPVAPSGPTGIPLTLYAGYELIQFSNPSDAQTGNMPVDGFVFTFTTPAAAVGANGTTIANNAFNSQCGKGNGCTNEVFQVIWAGAKYGITRDLDIIGAYYHYIQNQYVINGATAATSCRNTAALPQCAGWMDAVSVVLDWRFLPKWDAYIGTMYSAEFGGLANADIARNNVATTAGVRFRF